jgi:hypothetical protein
MTSLSDVVSLVGNCYDLAKALHSNLEAFRHKADYIRELQHWVNMALLTLTNLKDTLNNAKPLSDIQNQAIQSAIKIMEAALKECQKCSKAASKATRVMFLVKGSKFKESIENCASILSKANTICTETLLNANILSHSESKEDKPAGSPVNKAESKDTNAEILDLDEEEKKQFSYLQAYNTVLIHVDIVAYIEKLELIMKDIDDVKRRIKIEKDRIKHGLEQYTDAVNKYVRDSNTKRRLLNGEEPFDIGLFNISLGGLRDMVTQAYQDSRRTEEKQALEDRLENLSSERSQMIEAIQRTWERLALDELPLELGERDRDLKEEFEKFVEAPTTRGLKELKISAKAAQKYAHTNFLSSETSQSSNHGEEFQQISDQVSMCSQQMRKVERMIKNLQKGDEE